MEPLIAVHLGLLGAVVVGTAACLVARGGIARRSFGAVLWAFLPIFLIGVVGLLLLSMNGTPTVEWIVPGIAVLLVGAFCTSETLFRAARGGLLVACLLLCANFLTLTQRAYTSAPGRTAFAHSVARRATLQDAENQLLELHPAGTVLPATRVEEVIDGTVKREWHTPLTRLHRIEGKPSEIWHPGGVVGEVELEMRESGA